MNFIFAVVTLALKYYMLAQLPGDASLAYFGFGHEFHQLERENSIDILCPFAPETFCSPAPIVPVPSVTKTVQYIVDSASVTLKLPLSLPAPAPSWSPSVQPPVDPEFGASHTLAPTSTYKYVPVEDVLEELSCISMIFIVALILNGEITKGAAEESHGSVLTLSVLSFILVAVCFGRASVPSSLFERILDVLCFFLLLSVSTLVLLKFPRVSSDIAHQQQRTAHISSESIFALLPLILFPFGPWSFPAHKDEAAAPRPPRRFGTRSSCLCTSEPTFADMLSTSIAIESDIEEANTKAECKDPPIPRAGFVNSCVVAPFESATSNKSGSSSRTVMSTPANGTVNNFIIDSNVSKSLEHKLALFKANSASVLPCTTLTTELDPAYVPLPDDGNKLTAAVPTPFEHDDTSDATIPKADESATVADCIPRTLLPAMALSIL
ncbi:hypothetical protein ACEPAF_1236 [Sanghuangporus sanghuang]